jgi:predicted DNA binding protein
MASLQAKLRLKNVPNSPLADLSEVVHEPVTPLSWTLLTYILTGEGVALNECQSELPIDDVNVRSQQFNTLESNGERMETAETRGSVCTHLSDETGIVSEIYAINGDLHLILIVPNREVLRDLRADIEEKYGPVSVDHITEVRTHDRHSESTQVDLQTLTDRQHEVLKTAYQMGYFGYPRDANTKDIADELGITSSTVTEHLNTAQAKLFDDVFNEEL